MLSLVIYALVARQVLSADSTKDVFTREQFGHLQMHLQLGSFLNSLPMPTFPTSAPNLRIQSIIAPEDKDSSSPNLDGYCVTGFYDDDKCTNIVTGTTTKLNTCISTIPGIHQFVTATSTKISVGFFSDAECKESTLSATWAFACGGGLKFSYSPTKEILSDRPHLTIR